MTPEEFFGLLDKSAIVRKSTKKEKSAKLEEGDAEKLCSIVGMEMPESCRVLNEVYEKYKALGYYPKELFKCCSGTRRGWHRLIPCPTDYIR